MMTGLIFPATEVTFNMSENPDEKEVRIEEGQGKHINKRSLIIVFVLVLGIIIFTSSLKNKDVSKNKENINLEEKMTVNNVSDLPNSYQEMMSKEEPDYSFDNNNYQENTGYHEQALDEEKYKKLDKLFQEAELARRSGIGFGVNNRKNEKSSSGQITDISRDQNLNEQGNKNSFLKNEESNAAYLENFEEDPISPYEVKAGTIIPGIMITGINSDLPGNIVGQVRESVFDTVSGNYLLIPQGTKIFGTYDSNVTWGQNRSLIVWQRLIFPNGKSINLSNMPGVDLTGQAGFSDKVNNHFSTLLKGVVLTSITGAGSAIVTNDENNDYESEAAKAAGIAIINVGNNFAEKALSRQPTIEIRAGYRFNIMVNSDIILTPYE